jgi:tetratricopeptide (TPR) repeat protein
VIRDPHLALPKIERAVQLSGDKVLGPRLRLAELYLALGKFEEAKAEFQHLLQQDPRHPRAHLGLARLDLRAGQAESGRKHLEQASANDYTRKAALILSAEVHERAGETKEANQDMARVLDLPDPPEWPDEYVAEAAKLRVGESIRLKMAYQLIDRGQPRDALLYAQEAVNDYPQSAKSHAALGWVLLNLGQNAAAEQSLRKSLLLDNSAAQVWFDLGRARYGQKDINEAISCFQKAIGRKSDYMQAHFNLGLCFKEQGERPEAISAFRTALRCQPLSAPAHAQLGELLAAENRKDEALEHLQQAVDLNPNDSQSQKLLDKIRSQTGKP